MWGLHALGLGEGIEVMGCVSQRPVDGPCGNPAGAKCKSEARRTVDGTAGRPWRGIARLQA